MELTEEYLQKVLEERQLLSDSDSLLICLLIEKIKELEEENLTLWCQNNGLEKALRIARIGK